MKNWKLKEKFPKNLKEKFPGLSDVVVQMLYNRGLESEELAEHFLACDYNKLHNPFLFQDMEKAVERVWKAIETGEKIFIYGDYDADAVTANAVLQQTFKYLGVTVESYIPDRFTEGYGLNLEAFQKIKDAGATLVITVDCGTNSCDAADFCAANGIDLIITDHHEIIGPVPQALALINPKNPDDKYPYHEITGVGVAFKLACGMLADGVRVGARLARPQNNLVDNDNSGRLKPAPTENKKALQGWEKWLLDLVAIGTVADCHSLVGENRILVKYGLHVLAKSKWPGLRALCRTASLDFNQRPPDTYTLGFVIAPRLNAAGRLEHASIALDVLIEEDVMKAQEKSLVLEQINARRQDLTLRVMSEAREQAELLADRKLLVLMGEGWPKGVVGLVAGKLVEEFNKPVIVLEKGESEATGSARTIGDFNVVEALKQGSEYLIKFGGHKQAAGLTLKTEHFEPFYQKLLEYAELNLRPEDLEKNLELEAELTSNDLTLETVADIGKFEPFGVGNPRPKFMIKDMEVLSTKTVGNDKKHLQLQLKNGDAVVSCIGFNMGYQEKNLKPGETIDVAAELMEDSWNGRSQLKLRIVDLRKADLSH